MPTTCPTTLTGTITTNTNLQPGCYVVNTQLKVAQGAMLTLLPGTVVKFTSCFCGSSGLQVNGAVVANGTAAAPIVFTSVKDDSVGGDTNSDKTMRTAGRSRATVATALRAVPRRA